MISAEIFYVMFSAEFVCKEVGVLLMNKKYPESFALSGINCIFVATLSESGIGAPTFRPYTTPNHKPANKREQVRPKGKDVGGM